MALCAPLVTEFWDKYYENTQRQRDNEKQQPQQERKNFLQSAEQVIQNCQQPQKQTQQSSHQSQDTRTKALPQLQLLPLQKLQHSNHHQSQQHILQQTKTFVPPKQSASVHGSHQRQLLQHEHHMSKSTSAQSVDEHVERLQRPSNQQKQQQQQSQQKSKQKQHQSELQTQPSQQQQLPRYMQPEHLILQPHTQLQLTEFSRQGQKKLQHHHQQDSLSPIVNNQLNQLKHPHLLQLLSQEQQKQHKPLLQLPLKQQSLPQQLSMVRQQQHQEQQQQQQPLPLPLSVEQQIEPSISVPQYPNLKEHYNQYDGVPLDQAKILSANESTPISTISINTTKAPVKTSKSTNPLIHHTELPLSPHSRIDGETKLQSTSSENVSKVRRIVNKNKLLF